MYTTKQDFARSLRYALSKYYQGMLPSYNTIAKDFTFRAADLSPVSGETIRNWLMAKSMPHVSRMQVLLTWLGPEAFASSVVLNYESCNKGLQKSCPAEFVTICDMIHRLRDEEPRALKTLLNLLMQENLPP